MTYTKKLELAKAWLGARWLLAQPINRKGVPAVTTIRKPLRQA